MIKNIKKYKFYKTEENRWYISLPEYIESGGDNEELEMVEGADVLLDILSNYSDEVELLISVIYFEGSDKLVKMETQGCLSGAYYYNESYTLTPLVKKLDNALPDEHLSIWLCDVTKFIFGYFPNVIYFKVKK